MCMQGSNTHLGMHFHNIILLYEFCINFCIILHDAGVSRLQ